MYDASQQLSLAAATKYLNPPGTRRTEQERVPLSLVVKVTALLQDVLLARVQPIERLEWRCMTFDPCDMFDVVTLLQTAHLPPNDFRMIWPRVSWLLFVRPKPLNSLNYLCQHIPRELWKYIERCTRYFASSCFCSAFCPDRKTQSLPFCSADPTYHITDSSCIFPLYKQTQFTSRSCFLIYNLSRDCPRHPDWTEITKHINQWLPPIQFH